MSLARRLAHRFTAVGARPDVVRRIGTVEGLEHVNQDAPFVLVSNHVSFYDHFVYGALLLASQGRLPAFLTKAESFRGLRKAWFEEMGAVPVDRAAPARTLLDTTDALLAGGRTVVIYPEGTRARTPEMLPFKDGAARFAERAGVPVIPAALFGTREVLPVGARYPRRGRVDVVFGEPLFPDPLLPRGKRIADLIARSEAAVHALHERARQLSTQQPSADCARAIALMAEEAFERSFDLDDAVAPKARLEQGSQLLALALSIDPDCLEAQVGRARLTGLRATEGSALLKLPRAFATRRRALRALRRDPDHLMANYIMGRWHLSVPKALGARRGRAVEHFARAELLNSRDTRYPMAHAEALAAAGRPAEAVAAYDRVIAAEPPDRRSANRRERAVQARAALPGAHEVPALEPVPAAAATAEGRRPAMQQERT
jgi:1-acyl-sn-glycerol-3-phosphate acyltransferase